MDILYASCLLIEQGKLAPCTVPQGRCRPFHSSLADENPLISSILFTPSISTSWFSSVGILGSSINILSLAKEKNSRLTPTAMKRDLSWEKNDYRKNLSDLSLEGVLH
ncbi:hypothetical protein XU18_0010 [Perkinsela sp. CCAP 1560/4]|nr:hypothetical protein XU18_0010 [Perkinsela sp. CCAP 1560/4]|eukprot:KNH09325.1 hypothetical protein XU18_0010 [Perkinsela sp. CCAP 1560/4]